MPRRNRTPTAERNAPAEDEAEHAPDDDEAISASVEALRAAAEEMRRPKEGRSDIEKGVLPPFKADPNASAPQPPPLGREHDEVAAMADAIASHKLDVYLEPVVGLTDRKARHFDVSLRLRISEDKRVGAEEYIPLARRAGLLPLVDATRMARAAIVARHMDERGSGGCLFSAISTDLLTSERFLQEFSEACRQSPKSREPPHLLDQPKSRASPRDGAAVGHHSPPREQWRPFRNSGSDNSGPGSRGDTGRGSRSCVSPHKRSSTALQASRRPACGGPMPASLWGWSYSCCLRPRERRAVGQLAGRRRAAGARAPIRRAATHPGRGPTAGTKRGS